MTSSQPERPESQAFIRHLDQFPADLRDIRRLGRVFKLSALEVAQALESWKTSCGERGEESGSA